MEHTRVTASAPTGVISTRFDLRVLGALVTVLLGLTACSDGGPTGPASDNEGTGDPSSPTPLPARVSDLTVAGADGGHVTLRANRSDREIRRGRWHRFEIVLKNNTGSNADGEVHWWIDGQRAGEHRGVKFGRSGQSKRWQLVAWRPVWGGRGDVLLQAQHMWMDHFYVSGS